MDIFKKFVGRRNSVASEESCYQHRLGKTPQNRPPNVVTSNAFDDDDIFLAVARAMLFRYENEGMNEREAISSTLVTLEDKRGFLESLDFRSATIYLNHDEELEDSPIHNVVQRTRTIFGETLKLLWRESITGYVDGGMMMHGEDVVMSDCEDSKYHRPLKTPKNLHSPIKSQSETTAQTQTITTLQNSQHPTSNEAPSRRRRFFPETERCRTRIRLDFKLSGAEPVHSLRLDGVVSPHAAGSYAPPSPISSVQRLAFH